MDWTPLPCRYPEMHLWAASDGVRWQYVISFNEETGEWIASAKTRGVNFPFTTPRIDLGVFKSRDQAEAAVERHGDDNPDPAEPIARRLVEMLDARARTQAHNKVKAIVEAWENEGNGTKGPAGSTS